ncbi:MAG: DUF6941 family protein [Bdellovibrionia bacterium]
MFSSLSVGASVDQQTGSLSVFDVLEEIRVPELPVHLQSLVISLVLEKSEAKELSGKVLIHLIGPKDQQQMLGSGEMKVPAEQKRMKAVFRFGGFPIHQFGQYRFVISCLDQGGSKIAESLLDFEVIQVPQAAQGMAPSQKPPLAH